MTGLAALAFLVAAWIALATLPWRREPLDPQVLADLRSRVETRPDLAAVPCPDTAASAAGTDPDAPSGRPRRAPLTASPTPPQRRPVPAAPTPTETRRA